MSRDYSTAILISTKNKNTHTKNKTKHRYQLGRRYMDFEGGLLLTKYLHLAKTMPSLQMH